MILLCPPGVYRAQSDTDLLAGHLTGTATGRDVLDLGTGTGALALAAWRAGAASVTAVDLARRCVATTRLNCLLRRAPVRVHRGDLFAPVAGRRFGMIVANPPYVPSEAAVLPRHRAARSWDAGPDGRAVLDRICDAAPDHLTDDGILMIVHSQVCGPQATLDRLERRGLHATVVDRSRIPFGPVMRSRAGLLERRGLVAPGDRLEELVVVEARRG
ncbi:HemK2/MTQ2 family protein methyltransferase [Pseudonocardia sp. WMMC193]|uniref:HemK2/MTQ2 family protein methyltransferase n=1 Tax=Pseudonocardia sp. WMMC193 TaxID=2911965 RepID=UPI001F02378C|nr:HemK2/MTQ2 family protein methyltransferase [Pseudonocardia sp. WMMC193]MCF7547597.1 methyltransferase [Pseudonocardia sp. WMMC193]